MAYFVWKNIFYVFIVSNFVIKIVYRATGENKIYFASLKFYAWAKRG